MTTDDDRATARPTHEQMLAESRRLAAIRAREAGLMAVDPAQFWELCQGLNESEAEVARLRAALEALAADPYPAAIFTPLGTDELAAIERAVTASGVPAGLDRLHAGWARHLREVVRGRAREALLLAGEETTDGV